MDRGRVRRLIFVSSIAIMLFLSLSPIVFADWSEVSYSGSWSVRTRTEWSAEAEHGVGESYWEYENFTFEGYETSINFTKFKSYRNWWEYQDNKRVILLWNFSNIYVYINFLEQHNLWGWIEDRWVQVATSENSTAFTTSADFWWNPFAIQTQRDDFLNYPSYVKVYMDKISATEVQIVILNCRQDTTDNVLMWNATYSVSADWFSHNNLTFSIRHDGYGLFDGGMSDIIHTTPFSPDYGDTEEVKGFGIWDFIDNLIGGAVRSLPTWLQENIQMIGSWIAEYTVILAPLWEIVTSIIPILPMILVLWVIDAGMTSINKGSIEPIGLVFTTIFNTARGIIDMLIAGFHAIYDFIHFW